MEPGPLVEGLGAPGQDRVGAAAFALCRPLVAVCGRGAERAQFSGQFSVHVWGCKLSAHSALGPLLPGPRAPGKSQRHGPALEELLGWLAFFGKGPARVWG